MALRILALLLTVCWVASVVLIVSSTHLDDPNDPRAALGLLLFLVAWAGGPIVGFVLPRRLQWGYELYWAIFAFFMPVITLPVLAFWRLGQAPLPDVERARLRGDSTALAASLRYVGNDYTRANAAKALAESCGRGVEALLGALP